MGGFGFNSLVKGAKKMVQEVEAHPADLLLGPGAIPLAYAQSRGGLKGIGKALGIGGGTRRPPGHRASLAPVLRNPIDGSAIMGQDYCFTGYSQLAASSAVVAKTAILDFFTTTITPQFNANNKFPNTFHAEKIRLWVGMLTQAPATSKESLNWLKTLYVVFSNQTERARATLEQLGADFVSSASLTTSGGAQLYFSGASIGRDWDVAYDTNASYKMQVQSDFAIASTAAIIEFGYSMDGILFEGSNPDDEEIQTAVKRTYGLE